MLELKLYNTLTRRKETFRPLDPANVRLYVCGPTVYDFAHIGNARPIIVFDVLFRLLRHVYGAAHVTYARNITDVDDKIIARAAEEGVSPDEVTARTIEQFHKDVAALGCLAPTVEPRATAHVDGMKAMIERLIEKGCAYVGDDHVLFRVAAMRDYGRLSNRSLDEMLAGARVEVAPYKHDPMDFVLWKPSKPGEPGWPSPAGIKTPGRPGWHLECSAMSDRWLWDEARASLGEAGLSHPHEFDIHGGGIDLAFPHHENEIAQSRCCFGTPQMASVWMHNGFLQVEGRKMAKSEGNFVTINDLLSTKAFGGRSWSGPVLRHAMIKTNYDKPIDWTVDSLKAAHRELRDWAIRIVDSLEKAKLAKYGSGPLDASLFSQFSPSDYLIRLLCDNINTHEAINFLRLSRHSVTRSKPDNAKQFFVDLKFLGIFDERSVVIMSNGINSGEGIAHSYNRELDELRTAEINQNNSRVDYLVNKLRKIGFFVSNICEGCWRILLKEVKEKEIVDLIAARAEARKAKNWAEADRIRDELAAMGVALKDSKDPETGELKTEWEIAR